MGFAVFFSHFLYGYVILVSGATDQLTMCIVVRRTLPYGKRGLIVSTHQHWFYKNM